MPRFFFDVYDGHSSRDADGTELLSVDEARQEAIRLAGAILKEEARGLEAADDWRLEVIDEQGIICFVLGFRVLGRAASSSPANVAPDPPTRNRI